MNHSYFVVRIRGQIAGRLAGPPGVLDRARPWFSHCLTPTADPTCCHQTRCLQMGPGVASVILTLGKDTRSSLFSFL